MLGKKVKSLVTGKKKKYNSQDFIDFALYRGWANFLAQGTDSKNELDGRPH